MESGNPACVHSRDHIFSPVIMELGQNACIDETLNEFENESCRLKNYVTRSNLKKTLCTF